MRMNLKTKATIIALIFCWGGFGIMVGGGFLIGFSATIFLTVLGYILLISGIILAILSIIIYYVFIF